MGSYSGIERKLCMEAQIPFEAIVTGKLRRYFDLQNFVDFFKLPCGIIQAFLKLLKLRPKMVFSKGGYVGFPVILAAWMLRIPRVIHESDLTVGLATKLCAPFANKIFLAHEDTKKTLNNYAKKCEVIGNPVRLDLYDGDGIQAERLTGFSGKRPVLLIMGGSSGSAQINKRIQKEKTLLTAVYDVIHLTGEGKGDTHKEAHYFSMPYAHENLKDIYALASLALTRAGAGTLAELEALQLPAILFPLGTQASRGDQIFNAKFLCEKSTLYKIGKESEPLTFQLAQLPKRPKLHIENTATQTIALTLLSNTK